MATVAHLRKAALALPEAEEGTHFGMVSFSLRGKGFASVTKEGTVQLQMADEDAAGAVAAHPTGSRLTRFDKPIGCRPATQALLGAGLTTLDLVATRLAGELLALHGVGPKAVRVLSEALAERGSGLR